MNVNVTEAGPGDQGIGKVIEAVTEVCELKVEKGAWPDLGSAQRRDTL